MATEPRSPAPAHRARWRARALYALFLAALLWACWHTFIRVTDDYIEERAQSILRLEPNSLRHVAPEPGRNAAPVPEEGGATRLIAVGGSSVFDRQLGRGASWPERLAPLLTEAGFVGVKSLNAGVPGYSSRETLALYRDRLRQLSPDLVIIYLGWADLVSMRDAASGSENDARHRGLEVPDLRLLTASRPKRNFLALGEMLAARTDGGPAADGAASGAGARFADRADPETRDGGWDGSPGVEHWGRNLEALVREVLRDGALPVMVAENTLVARGLPREDRGLVRYDQPGLDHQSLVALRQVMVETARAVAAESEVPFLDLGATINGQRDYFADQTRLTPLGSEAFARALAEELAPILVELGAERRVASRHTAVAIGRWDFDAAGKPERDSGPLGLDGLLLGPEVIPDGCLDARCLAFDGADDSFNVPSEHALHLETDFRIELAVYLAPEAPRPSAGLAVKSGAYHFALRQGRPAFFGYGLEPRGWQVASEEVPAGAWHRLAVQLVDGRLMLLRDDRVLLESEVQGRLVPSNKPLAMGSGNGYFQGRLDEVSIHSLQLR